MFDILATNEKKDERQTKHDDENSYECHHERARPKEWTTAEWFGQDHALNATIEEAWESEDTSMLDYKLPRGTNNCF